MWSRLSVISSRHLSRSLISRVSPSRSIMAWMSSGRTNDELIQNLVRHHVIQTSRVAQAMKAVDRGAYTPKNADPYQDAPQSIGYGATISAPHMHAMCLETLKDQLQPGAKALDVGSGSGYLVACMARMVGDKGHVYGIEHIPQLVKFSQDNVESDAKELSNRITIAQGDGRLGLPSAAPFHAIHVGAAADKIPDALKQQLAVGGRMVIPVGPASGAQSLLVIDRTDENTWTQHEICGVRYVPLTDAKKQVDESK